MYTCTYRCALRHLSALQTSNPRSRIHLVEGLSVAQISGILIFLFSIKMLWRRVYPKITVRAVWHLILSLTIHQSHLSLYLYLSLSLYLFLSLSLSLSLSAFLSRSFSMCVFACLYVRVCVTLFLSISHPRLSIFLFSILIIYVLINLSNNSYIYLSTNFSSVYSCQFSLISGLFT